MTRSGWTWACRWSTCFRSDDRLGVGTPPPPVQVDGTVLLVGPGLIGRRQQIAMTALVEGQPDLHCTAPLPNALVRPFDREGSQTRPIEFVATGVLVILLSLAGGFGAPWLKEEVHKEQVRKQQAVSKQIENSCARGLNGRPPSLRLPHLEDLAPDVLPDSSAGLARRLPASAESAWTYVREEHVRSNVAANPVISMGTE